MQYARSKLFSIYLVLWTVLLGLATPMLMMINQGGIIRRYSRFWALGVAFGLRYIVGIKYRLVGDIPSGSGPKIIVSNHQSAWETIIFATLFPGISFIAKKELTKIPIFGWYLSKYPMILIDRGGGRSALNDMLRQADLAIKEGRSVLIFPEGTRIGVDEFKKYHFGVAALYKHLRVPVVTVAHNSGCYWNDDYAMKYSGEVVVKIIETINPGIDQQTFLNHIENSINAEKTLLATEAKIDDWRWALG